MILAKTLRIHEFRGVRDLTLDLGCANFAVCGPNGTGKSGIVDALEFVLTGNISRLAGSGTGGLSVKEHGPHVDSRNKPQIAFVSLIVHIPSLKKDATITRTVKDYKKPTIVPDTPDIQAVFAKVALHPELTLSRREIIKYVLAEPGKRAREVQELLRLDEVERLRALLQRIANACDRDVTAARGIRQEASGALQRALNLPKLDGASILEAANDRRRILGLPPFTTLEANTSLKDGITTAGGQEKPTKVLKSHAKSEIEVAKDKLTTLGSPPFVSSCAKASAAIKELAKDEKFLGSASRVSFLQTALGLFDGNACPVCDTSFTDTKFREHLQEKLARFDQVTKVRREVEKKLAPIIADLESTRLAVSAISGLGALLFPAVDTTKLAAYGTDIEYLVRALRQFLPLSLVEDGLASAAKIPLDATKCLEALEARVNELPDPNQQDAARDFLIVAQEKLEAFLRIPMMVTGSSDLS